MSITIDDDGPSISLQPSTFCGPYHHWVIAAPDSPEALRFSNDGRGTFLPAKCKRCGAWNLYRSNAGDVSTFDWNSFKLHEEKVYGERADWSDIPRGEIGGGGRTTSREVEDYDA